MTKNFQQKQWTPPKLAHLGRIADVAGPMNDIFAPFLRTPPGGGS